MATTRFTTRGLAVLKGCAPASILTALMTGIALPALAGVPVLGHATDGNIGLQPSGTDLRDQAAFFHNVILLPIITIISLFVLALLAWIVIRYNAKRNPVPARFSHNTTIEIIWTVVPVLILVGIAAFSFPLLYAYHNTPKADVTIKATGNQWYWAYEYPDAKIAEYTSNPQTTEQAGALYGLAVDNPIVVPVNKVTKVLVTGADVLHAFFVPAFGVQTTAIPGKVNEVWFKPRTVGKYYGECNELCGVNHSFMPIEVDVVSQADYDAWVASKATKPSPAAPPAISASTAPSTTAAPAPAATPAATPSTPAAAPAAPTKA